MTQRQVVTALLIVQIISTVLLAIGQVLRAPTSIILPVSIAIIVLLIVLLWVYRRGWEPARMIDIVVVTIAVSIATPDEFVFQRQALIVLVPLVLAQVLGGPGWVAGSALGMLAIFTLRAGPERGFMTAYTADLRTIAIFIFIVASMALSRVIANTAVRNATRQQQRAEEAFARIEAQAQTLQEQTQELQAQNQRQQQLLDLVAQLETPAILLAQGVLLAPVVGPIDDQRAQSFVGRLLEAASLQRARLVIIDIAGASNVDSRAAALLGQAVQALRLIGCQVAISGISAELAHTLVTAGVAFDSVLTVRTPREAIEYYQILIASS